MLELILGNIGNSGYTLLLSSKLLNSFKWQLACNSPVWAFPAIAQLKEN